MSANVDPSRVPRQVPCLTDTLRGTRCGTRCGTLQGTRVHVDAGTTQDVAESFRRPNGARDRREGLPRRWSRIAAITRSRSRPGARRRSCFA